MQYKQTDKIMNTPVEKIKIKKIDITGILDADDFLAVEEPLEIRIIYGAKQNRMTKSISITMRTPGNDFELATGFLFTEGIIENKEQILNMRTNAEDCQNRQNNIINIELHHETEIDMQKLERHFYTSSSCGVCGKASINAIHTLKLPNAPLPSLPINQSIIFKLPERLSQHQQIFEQTGGLHASALFSLAGHLQLVREDVGRHNALDKLIGASLLSNTLPLSEHILLLSGRASFELIQKAAMADIRVICAVGTFKPCSTTGKGFRHIFNWFFTRRAVQSVLLRMRCV